MTYKYLEECPMIMKVIEERHKEAIESDFPTLVTDEVEAEIAKILYSLPTREFAAMMAFGFLSDRSK